jgi:hypothetical protein
MTTGPRGRRRRLPHRLVNGIAVVVVSLLVVEYSFGSVVHWLGDSIAVPMTVVAEVDVPHGGGMSVEFRPTRSDGAWAPIAPTVPSAALVRRYEAGEALVGVAVGARFVGIEVFDSVRLTDGAQYRMANAGALGGISVFFVVAVVAWVLVSGARFARRRLLRPGVQPGADRDDP